MKNYNSGLNCPTPAIPIPAFAVPNAAPLYKDESFMVLVYTEMRISWLRLHQQVQRRVHMQDKFHSFVSF